MESKEKQTTQSREKSAQDEIGLRALTRRSSGSSASEPPPGWRGAPSSRPTPFSWLRPRLAFPGSTVCFPCAHLAAVGLPAGTASAALRSRFLNTGVSSAITIGNAAPSALLVSSTSSSGQPHKGHEVRDSSTWLGSPIQCPQGVRQPSSSTLLPSPASPCEASRSGWKNGGFSPSCTSWLENLCNRHRRLHVKTKQHENSETWPVQSIHAASSRRGCRAPCQTTKSLA